MIRVNMRYVRHAIGNRNMRPCPTCKSETAEQPYKHLYNYRCRDCCRADSLSRYHKKRKEMLDAGIKPTYKKKSAEWYRAEYQQRVSDPETRKKVFARARLRRAITLGHIKRQPCEVCGDPKSHGHHDDYSKPLDVRWLCHAHHCEAHNVHCQTQQTTEMGNI